VFAVLVKGCGIGVAVHFVERVLGPRFELQGDGYPQMWSRN
jgi:hypothetical protein